MIIHNLDQQTPEWFKVRLGKLTASKAQAIATAGKGLDTLCLEKVAELLTKRQPTPFSNADTERGNELEEMARSAYELETGNLVTKVGFIEHNEWVGCSPDGLVGEDGLVEFKCKNDVNFLKYLLEGEIDAEHEWQMQMQMWVADRKWCDYVLFNDGFEQPLVIARIARDDAKIEKIKVGIEKAIEKMDSMLAKVKKN